MSNYYAKITLYPVDGVTAKKPALNLIGEMKQHPTDAIKSAAQVAIEALLCLSAIDLKHKPDCDHHCSCRNTYCCVCD